MKNRYLLSCFLIMLATLAASLLVYQQLPARIPTHWNMHGEIDRHGPRAAIFIHTGIMLLFMGLWTILPRISPKHFTVDDFRNTYWYTCLTVVGLLAYIQCVLLWSAYTQTSATGRAMLGGMAGFTGLMGNVIGKVRRNFWLGIRTPWTLANERVWYSTHRLAGKSLVGASLLALGAVLADLPGLVAVGLLGAGFLIPVAWSLLYYKRLERSGRLEA
jgi:uncharacterized membrane protein